MGNYHLFCRCAVGVFGAIGGRKKKKTNNVAEQEEVAVLPTPVGNDDVLKIQICVWPRVLYIEALFNVLILAKIYMNGCLAPIP
jgi:hypothetical protein